MHSNPGGHPPLNFAVRADRAPQQEVTAEHAVDAAITAIESGASRVEAFPTGEEIDDAMHADKLRNRYDTRREEDAMRAELAQLRVRGLLR